MPQPKGCLQDHEKTNIYVGMHVIGFRIVRPICSGPRRESGCDSPHFDAATASRAEVGSRGAFNRGRKTRGSADIHVQSSGPVG
jgi:hypothetical protein